MHPRSRVLLRSSFVLALLLLLVRSGDLTTHGAASASPRDAGSDAATTQRVNEQYGRLPLSFEKNDGQSDPGVEFQSRGLGYALFLSAGGEAVFALGGTPGHAESRSVERAGAVASDRPSVLRNGAVLRLTLVGARVDAHAEGREPLPGKVNYLRGTDRTRWRTGIRTYARVAYEEVYPGVDLVYYGNQRQLEYDFIVRPGADASAIALDAEGAERIEIDDQGDLVLHVGTREIRQRKPVVYQERQGVRREIEGGYVLRGSRVSFQVGTFDPALPLVIDPVLVYSTYLGGGFHPDGSDFATAVAVDAIGQAYVAGVTESTDFPATPGAYATTPQGNDVFVTKIDASGGALVYSTFLGGSDGEFGGEFAHDIAVDALGHAYVAGATTSIDFPTTSGAYDRVFAGPGDGFVTKLDPAGAALVYSTLLGGGGYDAALGIVVDGAGHAYAAGGTDSSDFPTTPGAFDRSHRGREGFVTMLDPAGAALVYSTFLGGSDEDTVSGIALDALGHAYVLGETSSTDFPTTAGALDTTPGGHIDLFVTKLDVSGATPVYSTYLGGGAQDSARGLAIDHLGMAYVTGYTFSVDFPVTPGAFDTSFAGSTDVFVTKLDAAGATLAYSTFLGGSLGEVPGGIAVGSAGDAYVIGQTSSRDFPVTPGAFETTFAGNGEMFVTKLDASGAILAYSTFLGSPCAFPLDLAGIALDVAGQAYVVGAAEGNFPTTPGAHDTSHNGGCDAFVTKLDAAGSSLRYSTYLGGFLAPGGRDQGVAVAVDGTGSAYMAGVTYSLDFPTTAGAYDATLNGYNDVFVTKLDAAGTAVAYSTFLGGSTTIFDSIGSGSEKAAGIAVDSAGNVYVAGGTNSLDFPTTVGAFDTIPSGDDLFVAKLDPSGASLSYSTFLGPSGSIVRDIAVDASGNAYLTGGTQSRNFPVTPGAYDTDWGGGFDVFLTKLDATGATLAYSTFLGGGLSEQGTSVSIDPAGEAYVAGSSTGGFPTTAGAFDTTYNDFGDAFVAKLDANGGSLVYSTYLGGSRYDVATGIAVDPLGQAYVTGRTESNTFPEFPATIGAYDTSFNGQADGFVTKLNATGTALAYSTFLGGNAFDLGVSVAVDQGGRAHVTGFTNSNDFPSTPDAFDTSWNYANDAFLATLDASGATLAYATFIGGSNDDVATGIAVDPAGNAYVTGNTSSPNFPTTPGAYDTEHNSTQEAFVIKFGAAGPPRPVVNITANGSDGPLPLAATDPLAIMVSFDVGSATVIDPAEVYIGVTTPAGRLWFDTASRTFVPGLRPAYTGPLSSFGPVTLVDLPNVSSLPAGQYFWFVWVDYDMNGVPNGGAFDVVLTTVQ